MRATCDSPSFVGCEKWGAESTETEWASKQAFASRAGGGATPEASKQRSSESRVRPAGSVFPCNSEYKPALPCAFRAAAILARCALLLLLARALSPLSPSFRASHREAPGSPSQPTRRRPPPPPGIHCARSSSSFWGSIEENALVFLPSSPAPSSAGSSSQAGRTDGRTEAPTQLGVLFGLEESVRPAPIFKQGSAPVGGVCVKVFPSPKNALTAADGATLLRQAGLPPPSLPPWLLRRLLLPKVSALLGVPFQRPADPGSKEPYYPPGQ